MYQLFITCSNADYRGAHLAPDREGGAPLYDVTLNDIYPSDFYSNSGLRLYGDSSTHCRQAWPIILACHGKPNAKVKIYRAVPKVLSKDEKIAELVKAKAAYLKTGRIPRNSRYTNKSTYYDQLCDEIEQIERSEEKPVVKPIIQAGDWVAITKSYALEHGRSNLRGGFAVLTKTVRADQLYTSGDSMNEWGYWP